MGRKPLVDWKRIPKYKTYQFKDYSDYRKTYTSAYRAKRNPRGEIIWGGIYREYILTLDCNTVTGATRHAQYCQKVREGKI